MTCFAKTGAAGRMAMVVGGLLFLGTTSPVSAQGGGGGGQNAAARQQMLVDSVTAGLHLEGDLAQTVSVILMAETDKRTKAREGAGQDREAMVAAMQKVAADVEQEMAAVLSADQLALYKTIRARVAPGFRGRRPGSLR